MRAAATALLVFLLVAPALSQTPQPSQTPSPVYRAVASIFVAGTSAERDALIKTHPEILERPFFDALVAEGTRFRTTGDYDDADRHFRAAIDIGERHNKPAAKVSGLNGQMLMMSARTDHAGARLLGEEALAIATAANDLRGQQVSVANLGLIQRRTGDYRGALETQLRALEMARTLDEPLLIGRALHNVAVAQDNLGDTATALENLLESLAIYQKNAPPKESVSALIAIGAIYAGESEYALAADYYQRAIDASGNEITVSVAGAYNNLAHAQMAMGHDTAAKKAFERALPIARQTGNSGVESTIIFNLGQIARRASQFNEAESLQRQALAIREQANDHNGIVVSLAEIANLLTVASRAEEALPFAERSLALASESGLLSEQWRAEMMIGHAYFALKRDAEAQTFYQRSIQSIEKLRARSASGSVAMQATFKHFAPFYGLATVHARAGRTMDALLTIDRSRARTLVDIVSTRPATVVRTSGDSEASRWHRGVTPELTLDQVATSVPRGLAIVTFVLDEHAAWAYVATRGTAGVDVTAHVLPLSPDALVTVTNRFSREVSSRNLAFASSARSAYDALLGPLESRLAGTSDLIIVPDGELWKVPFQALRTSRGKFLLEERAVSYTPSIAALVALEDRRRARAAAAPYVVAIGDPAFAQPAASAGSTEKRGGPMMARLPETAREARAIGRLYGSDRGAVLVDSAATEKALRLLAPRATIWHVATHSVLDDTNPMSSRLMLAAGDGKAAADDGRLEAWEMMDMSINADIAVLSACQTARGGTGYGEGMIGLSWSLFASGASTAVVSQWEVDSASTTSLMIGFHQRLLAPGKSAPAAPAALRQSAIALMKNPAYRHPFYWAGFIAVGAR